MSRRRTGAIAAALALGGFLVVSAVAPSSLRKCSALAPLGMTLMNGCSDFFRIIDLRSANQKVSDYTNAIEINPNDAAAFRGSGAMTTAEASNPMERRPSIGLASVRA